MRSAAARWTRPPTTCRWTSRPPAARPRSRSSRPALQKGWTLAIIQGIIVDQSAPGNIRLTGLPAQWTQSQWNLARACVLLGDDSCAADSYAGLRRQNPDNPSLFSEVYLYRHEKRFDFAQAFTLNPDWPSRHPEDLITQTNFVETHLTSGRLAEVPERLAKLWPQLSLEQRIPLAAIGVAALMGLGRLDEAEGKRRALRQLVAAQPADAKPDRMFACTRHFLATDSRFARGRGKLLGMIDALLMPDRAARLQALDACGASTSPD